MNHLKSIFFFLMTGTALAQPVTREEIHQYIQTLSEQEFTELIQRVLDENPGLGTSHVFRLIINELERRLTHEE